MDAVGLRVDFHITPFQDAIKELIAGKFQMYFGGYGGSASGYAQLIELWGKSPHPINFTRFKLAEYDEAFVQFLRQRGTRGPDRRRRAGCRSSRRRTCRSCPAVFRLETNYVQPWVQGFNSPVFQTYWKYLDIDVAARRKAMVK